MLGTDFILNCFAKENITHLFMVPGGLVDPFLPALGRQTTLKPIVAAHEGGAAYMADGYARASQKFGAALCIGGPGLANTVSAVATAKTDGSPLFVLSGEVETFMEGLGEFQDASSETIDDVGLLKELTRFSSSVDHPKNLGHLLRHAMLHLLTNGRGPVHLSIPRDSQEATIHASYEAIDEKLTHPKILSAADAEKTLSLLLGQEGKSPTKIAILAGAGVEHAGSSAALLRFAEKWGIPVATTLRAKGVFPEDHSLSLGVYGYAGTHHAKTALQDPSLDLLMLFGTGFNERDTMHWTLPLKTKNTLCVSIDTLAMGTHCPSHSVVGDVGAYLDWLEMQDSKIAISLTGSRQERKQWLAAIVSKPRLQDPENCVSQAIPIHPARVMSDLREVFPRDGILLVDSGAHRAFAGHYWSAYTPLTYISATNLGPMGWAIPAAIGVQCAQPTKKVAVITGDGCMHMHGIEVATAARYHLPIIYIVINNAALGNVWLRAHTEGAVPAELTALPDLSWADFGRALGCDGITVTKPEELKNAFQKALQSKKPTVIDMKADKAFPTPVKDWVEASAHWSYQE